jgi:hypothetical protein
MKYVRIALLSAAAIYLLPFATPAYAELGHPSGCAQCGPVEITAPTGRVPVIGPELETGIPPGARALAPETGSVARSLANRCHVETWDIPGSYRTRYITTCL